MCSSQTLLESLRKTVFSFFCRVMGHTKVDIERAPTRHKQDDITLSLSIYVE